MRQRRVGDVVVVEDMKPVGILTDRDIMVRVTAAGLDPFATVVRKVMSSPPVTVTRDAEVREGIALMTAHGIRRLLIVNDDGRLTSILTLDDILLLHLSGHETVADMIRRQLEADDSLPVTAITTAPSEKGDMVRSPKPVTFVHHVSRATVYHLPIMQCLRLRCVGFWRQWAYEVKFWLGVVILALVYLPLVLGISFFSDATPTVFSTWLKGLLRLGP